MLYYSFIIWLPLCHGTGQEAHRAVFTETSPQKKTPHDTHPIAQMRVHLLSGGR